MIILLVLFTAGHIKFVPERCIYFDLVGVHIGTFQGGHCLKFSTFSPNYKIGFGTAFFEGYDMEKRKSIGSILPLSLYWIPSYKILHHRWGKSAQLTQFYLTCSFWSIEFDSTGKSSSFIGKNSFLNLGIEIHPIPLLSLQAGFLRSLTQDYAGAYVAIEPHLGSWFVKGKSIVYPSVVFMPLLDTLNVFNEESFASIDTSQEKTKKHFPNESELYETKDSLLSIKAKKIVYPPDVCMSLLDTQNIFNEEFFTAINTLQEKIKKYFPNESEFYEIKDSLASLKSIKLLKLMKSKAEAEKTGKIIGGVVTAGCLCYTLWNSWEDFREVHDEVTRCEREGEVVSDELATGCCILGSLFYGGLLGSPFAMLGGILTGKKVGTILVASSISPSEIKSLNLIITNYNKMVKENFKGG